MTPFYESFGMRNDAMVLCVLYPSTEMSPIIRANYATTGSIDRPSRMASCWQVAVVKLKDLGCGGGITRALSRERGGEGGVREESEKREERGEGKMLSSLFALRVLPVPSSESNAMIS